jgi:hypothetical protein
MTANALKDWCRFAGTGSSYIDPGSPWQNPYVESFGSGSAAPTPATNNTPKSGDPLGQDCQPTRATSQVPNALS